MKMALQLVGVIIAVIIVVIGYIIVLLNSKDKELEKILSNLSIVSVGAMCILFIFVAISFLF